MSICRLAQLDYHPYYTRESFVQKTAGWLKWKEGEEKRIHEMLKVRTCAVEVINAIFGAMLTRDEYVVCVTS